MHIRHYISFIKFDVAIATIKNLLIMAVLKKCLNKTEMKVTADSFELSTNVYIMYLFEMTGAN